MLKLVVFVLCIFWNLSNAQGNPASDLNYTIKFNKSQSQCLEIEALLPTDKNGDLLINIPSKGVSSLNITPAFNRAEDVSSYVKRFSFQKQMQINVSYQLCMVNEAYSIDLPIIESNYLQLLSMNSFVLPLDNLDERKVININLQDTPEHFTYINSFGLVKTKKIEIKSTINEFVTFVLAGVKGSLSAFQSGNSIIYGVSNNPKKAFSKDQKKNLKNIVSFQKMLMGDKNKDPLILSFAFAPEASQFLGRHFTNTVSISIPNQKPDEIIMRIFSHEYFHRWLGLQLVGGKHFDELLWFVEGIDDYVGLKSAYEVGALSFQGYLNGINENLMEHYLSPLRSSSYKDLYSIHLTDVQHHKTTQIRGHLAAIALQGNKRIALKGDPIIAILKKLLSSIEGKYKMLTPEIVDAEFKNTLEIQEWIKFREFVDTGENLGLSSELENGRAKLVKKKVLAADYGFDLEVFFKQHKIKNLKSNTPEYKAGLRENMDVLNYTISLHDPTKKVTIYVNAEGRAKPIEFVPGTKYELIPQYVSQKIKK